MKKKTEKKASETVSFKSVLMIYGGVLGSIFE